jgi:hypothetical protein
VLAITSVGTQGPKGTRWLAAGLACLAAVPWVMLGAGAPTSLLVWVPAALVAIGFVCAFLIVAVASLRGRRRADFLLIGLTVLSLVTLLYAPALAMGGPIAGAPESVVCPPGTGICWNYLHSAFKVHAAVLVAALVLAAKVQLAGRASGA